MQPDEGNGSNVRGGNIWQYTSDTRSARNRLTITFGTLDLLECQLVLYINPRFVENKNLFGPEREISYIQKDPHTQRTLLIVHLGNAFAQGMHDEFIRVLSKMRAKALERLPRCNNSAHNKISEKIGSYLRGGQRHVSRTHGRRSLRRR